ncbi:MAG: hypothetical protein GQ570_06290 [Helicobacteraceae bacterium]|nr:hypothetical protein [Helicobacteraceae bacterium]
MALELFNDETPQSSAFGAMGYYTLEDFEIFAKILGIKEKRLIKIFDRLLQSSGDVHKMIGTSFLSEEAKEAYSKNYFNRLEKCLCYSIDSYPFRGIAQSVIDKFNFNPKV